MAAFALRFFGFIACVLMVAGLFTAGGYYFGLPGALATLLILAGLVFALATMDVK